VISDPPGGGEGLFSFECDPKIGAGEGRSRSTGPGCFAFFLIS